MAHTSKKIQISEIRLPDEVEKRNSNYRVVKKLGPRTSRDALNALLTSYPVVLKKSDTGYQVLSGMRTLLIARALHTHDEKISVTVVDDKSADLDVFACLDDIYAPLLFQSDVKELESVAERHLKNGTLHRLGRDLHRREYWVEILKPEKAPKVSAENAVPSGEKKRRGRKLKQPAASSSEGAIAEVSAAPEIAASVEVPLPQVSAVEAGHPADSIDESVSVASDVTPIQEAR